MNRSDEASTSKRQTVERKKSNLAFAFFCLDKERAKDMEIFYAFCRLMDDIADEPARAAPEKRAELASWKGEISRIYGGSKDLSPSLRQNQKPSKERRALKSHPFCFF